MSNKKDLFNEQMVDQAMAWLEENDLADSTLTDFSSSYAYLFKDEDISLTTEEESYLFFLWSTIIHVYFKKISTEPRDVAANLETMENALWSQIEEEKDGSTADRMFRISSEEELFAFVEDALAYDGSDPNFPLPSKELTELLFVKFISLINVLHETAINK